MTTKDQIYKNLGALEPIKRILAEADKAINESSRTIETSDIPEVLGGLAGGSIGVGIGYVLVSTSGVAGVSAAGITSGLATLGAVVGGGMIAGVFVAAAPMAVLGMTGYALLSERNKRRLTQVKEALFQEAVRKHDAIIRELNQKVEFSQERNRYLDSLNILLRQVIEDLKKDLGK
ncbi:MAG: hypothetical protein R3E79_13060 [Caldilineaceae bacterium]